MECHTQLFHAFKVNIQKEYYWASTILYVYIDNTLSSDYDRDRQFSVINFILYKGSVYWLITEMILWGHLY